MRLTIILDKIRLRQWHRQLVEALQREGHQVFVDIRLGEAKPQRDLERWCSIERQLYRAPADGLSAPLDASALVELAQRMPTPADCTIDLADAGFEGRGMAPLFEGRPDEAAALTAVINGGAPVVAITYRDAGEAESRAVALARPAFNDRAGLTRAKDQIAWATMRLLLQTIRRISLGEALPELPLDAPEPITASSAALYALRTLAGRVTRRLSRFVARPDHWRIGWRWLDANSVTEGLAWPDAGYRFVGDDRKRYFADPFVFQNEGIAHVFCEEFPYATQRGIISHFTIGRDGSVSAPRPVLELPYHVSYPFVFAEAGEIWMIPESSANRTIEIYRAERFPDRWTREAVLIGGVNAFDATLLTHAGRRWLFAGTADGGGSSWEGLGLFHSENLLGPWTAHPLNPVVIDVRAARPAGAMFAREGRLFRPAQDCSADYGSALTLCEVTRLDPQGYAQKIVARLPPRAEWRASGVHTLNEAGGLEVMDIVGVRRRF